jgi:hypothetical protein
MQGKCARLYMGSWAAGSRAVVSDASTSALSPARELSRVSELSGTTRLQLS